ncbi:hypothetical protein QR680_010175 [Steinernema hermaphroditum]|uniref:Uncharacterized protein n=1 Tax=Steinernema hermaphroditum TaxID=289476 RepID=A0AA39IN16_9BILA|nr:hypothetical protein QR680_010175 [Steinernema hermaphroditum]
MLSFKVVGAILMSSWVGIPTMAFLLALHRLTAITIGTPTATHETAFYYMLLVSAWILYVSIMVLHLFDDAAIYFNTDYLSFDYVPTSFNSTMALYESYMILLMLSLSLACYIGIFLYLLGYKKFMKVERPEVILLVQAFVIFSYIASLRCVWQFGEPLYMDRPSVVRFLDICNCLMGGINPIVYLGFSKGLRKQFIAVFRRRGVRVTESTLQTESPSNSYIQFESCSVSYI